MRELNFLSVYKQNTQNLLVESLKSSEKVNFCLRRSHGPAFVLNGDAFNRGYSRRSPLPFPS